MRLPGPVARAGQLCAGDHAARCRCSWWPGGSARMVGGSSPVTYISKTAPGGTCCHAMLRSAMLSWSGLVVSVGQLQGWVCHLVRDLYLTCWWPVLHPC
jgi:hypothetical protein